MRKHYMLWPTNFLEPHPLRFSWHHHVLLLPELVFHTKTLEGDEGSTTFFLLIFSWHNIIKRKQDSCCMKALLRHGHHQIHFYFHAMQYNHLIMRTMKRIPKWRRYTDWQEDTIQRKESKRCTNNESLFFLFSPSSSRQDNTHFCKKRTRGIKGNLKSKRETTTQWRCNSSNFEAIQFNRFNSSMKKRRRRDNKNKLTAKRGHEERLVPNQFLQCNQKTNTTTHDSSPRRNHSLSLFFLSKASSITKRLIWECLLFLLHLFFDSLRETLVFLLFYVFEEENL